MHKPVLAEIGYVLSNENGLVWSVLSGQVGIKDSNEDEVEFLPLYERVFSHRWELKIQTRQCLRFLRRDCTFSRNTLFCGGRFIKCYWVGTNNNRVLGSIILMDASQFDGGLFYSVRAPNELNGSLCKAGIHRNNLIVELSTVL